MADIRFSCPNCEKHLVIDEAGAGLIITCPKCNNDTTVPIPGAEVDVQPIKTQSADPLKEDVPHEDAQIQNSNNEPDPLLDLADTPSEELHTVTCSNCGALLDVDINARTAKCLFCGSNNLVSAPEQRHLSYLDAPNLTIAHYPSSMSFKDVKQIIIDAIKSGECSLDNANSLKMEIKGLYIPAWLIQVSGECHWSGVNLEERVRPRVRVVNAGGHKKEELYEEKYTVEIPDHGSQFAKHGIFLPAANGISREQLSSLTDGDMTKLAPGAPNSSVHHPVAQPSLSQDSSWNVFDGDGLFNSLCWRDCIGNVNVLKQVSATIHERSSSLLYFPCAVVTYTANQSEYRHFVNLQTGKFSGDIPLDISKVIKECVAAKQKQNKNEKKAFFWLVSNIIYMVGSLLYVLNWFESDGKLVALIRGLFLPLWAIIGMFEGPDRFIQDRDLLGDSLVQSFFFSWLGCLLYLVISIIIFASRKNAWVSFLATRKAFLLRLMVNPTEDMHHIMVALEVMKEGEKAEFVDPKFEQLRELLAKAAHENRLEALDMDLVKPVCELTAHILLILDESPEEFNLELEKYKLKRLAQIK